ncbi:hypothetical protein GQ55_3G058500 [Panicum hallii var. hallii]|uniref:Jacalin-type lectin domain-containing protein n=1 Tax=Panicum hallii var. hallii TaxID=1504633 RepID=A0A2T7E664_9POAL|nr:hypothetical protein GQ55_3G058500 [Panicum hallii var. hallii]
MVGKTPPIKVGPWGRSKGSPFDITKPFERLESVTIQFGRVINSFGFTYVDAIGQKHTVGPVDGDGRGKLTTASAMEPCKQAAMLVLSRQRYTNQSKFSFSFLFFSPRTFVVTYLRIRTNLETYEIHDTGLTAQANTSVVTEFPFSVPLPENTSIVGFFGRQGDNLNAIGVYGAAAKIGASGGGGGTEFDVTEPPMRLESMTIRAGDSVDSVGFSYVDETGHKHTVGPFGGTGGQLATIKLAPVEYVRRLSGTIGQAFGSEARMLVASLQIRTNISDDQFSIPLPENVSVVGFFGRAGNLLDAIGVYIAYKSPNFPIAHHATEETSGDKDEETSKNTTATTSQPPLTIITGQTFPIKIGTWGSSKKSSFLGEKFGILGWGGGPSPTEFDATEPPRRLDGVMIRSGDIIDVFGFSYADEAGQKHTIGPYGGRGGSLTTIQLEPSEYVKHFSGTTGTYVGSPVVASLTIETNLRVNNE